jgi:transposase
MRGVEMEKARKILRLKDAGMTEREIAGATGCSLGKVNTILVRAREAGIIDLKAIRNKDLSKVLYPAAKKAEEHMLVDWAGLTMQYTNFRGEAVKVYLFVADLPTSSYLYGEPFPDMGQASWSAAHVNTFEYYDGAAAILVPDNTKTAVIKPKYYDPNLNKTYHELARYYGAAIIPARSRAPRDKAPVETGM